MKDIKYISIFNIDYGDNSLVYSKNIGEVLNMIYDYIINDSEDEHILALEDSVISERISGMNLRVEIYRIGEGEPFAILNDNVDSFHDFVDKIFKIEDVKNENFQILKFDKFKKIS